MSHVVTPVECCDMPACLPGGGGAASVQGAHLALFASHSIGTCLHADYNTAVLADHTAVGVHHLLYDSLMGRHFALLLNKQDCAVLRAH